jgi:hypothetical protein
VRRQIFCDICVWSPIVGLLKLARRFRMLASFRHPTIKPSFCCQELLFAKTACAAQRSAHVALYNLHCADSAHLSLYCTTLACFHRSGHDTKTADARRAGHIYRTKSQLHFLSAQRRSQERASNRSLEMTQDVGPIGCCFVGRVVTIENGSPALRYEETSLGDQK